MLRHEADLADVDAPATPVDYAIVGRKARDRVEQRRLAGAVRTDQPDDLARIERRADIVKNAGPATLYEDIGKGKPVRHAVPLPPRRAITANSMGTPATAVMMPTGMTAAGEMNLPNTEAPTRMIAPITAESGSA